MLKSYLKYWSLLLLLGLTMYASALYLPPSHFSHLSSPSSSSHSSHSARSSLSSISSSKSLSSTRILHRGLAPGPIQYSNYESDFSPPDSTGPLIVPLKSSMSSSSSSSSSSSFPSSSSSLSQMSLSSLSSLYHKSLSSHKGLDRRRRNARSKGYMRSRSRRMRTQPRTRRSRRYWNNFYRVVNSHKRYRSEQAFVENLFKHFDINADNVIEREEFRAVLQILGVVDIY